ncbi:B-cell antigen receptor complex-associated protein alpha chain-like [Heterodontus francisci]|uniref:B-cell antigen receptor complex-associated protein alpha chain-like n=1 Tax=Heterodontus francisci TaxID=7792 RepID=UPI00355B83AF
MATSMVQTLTVGILLTAMMINVGSVNIQTPSVRAEVGSLFQMQCPVSSKDPVHWERKSLNDSVWQSLSSENAQYTWQKVEESDLGIYRCQNKKSKEISCEVRLRLYKPLYPKLLNIKDSVKNIILMVEGILLLSLVVIPGTILLRNKSQKSLREKIKRYKEENENLYEVGTPSQPVSHTV